MTTIVVEKLFVNAFRLDSDGRSLAKQIYRFEFLLLGKAVVRREFGLLSKERFTSNDDVSVPCVCQNTHTIWEEKRFWSLKN